jgi:vacuolar-type H+-ATPase subunit H
MSLNKSNNHNKLKAVQEVKQLIEQYEIEVEKLGSIFLSRQQKEILGEEIKLLEMSLKSKFFIASQMKGF